MFLSELLNLSQGFKKYFDITPAVADDLQVEAYGVWHQMYCEELGYEPCARIAASATRTTSAPCMSSSSRSSSTATRAARGSCTSIRAIR